MSRCILFVIDSLFPLGPAAVLSSFVRSLQREHDFDVHIATLTSENPPIWQGDFAGATIHPIRKRPQRDAGLPLRLRKLVRRLDPDIVHSWCGQSNTIAAIGLFRLDQSRFLSTELVLRQPQRFLERQIARRGHRRPEKLIVSHETLKIAAIENGIREHRLCVIPTGIPAPRATHQKSSKFIRNLLGLNSTSLVACSVAPLVPTSRLKDLIWATDLLACVHDDFHLLILGRGSQLWRLKKFASQTAASRFIHFLGHPAEAARVLAGIDIYWNSHLRCPLDPVIMTAMLRQKPIVSVYGPGTMELIEPQVTGLATNFGARDEFARWSKYLIELPDSAKQLAEQGLAHVQQKFPLSTMVDGYLKIYNWCS